MGVDWLACKNCGETFPDCGDFTYCECGTYWCSYECAESDGYERPEENDESSCKYCREEDYDNYELLDYVIEKYYGGSRGDLVKEYKER